MLALPETDRVRKTMRLVVIVESRDNTVERHAMNTRIVFDREFTHTIRIRGLTMGELAKRAGRSQATASAAVHGKPLNMRSAVQLARALAACPVIEELERWAAGA
jgi:predicted transcriptional regulator